ncbi:MAG TPA: AraC family transcriptional regulator [Planctomycetia bacterium]|nr:AraC family transcriptional regulator [Planctomycetia bacterium]
MSTARATYAARILEVQLFIQRHLDEPLNLERLAEVAGYSPYHFHRIFRGQTGESADDYVRRLRMEQAAHSLRYRERTVLEIAMDSGYGSHEAFTRAFQRTFGASPSEYQAMERPPLPLKESSMSAATHSLQDVRIENLPPHRLAALRVVGKYGPEILGPAFGQVCEWAGMAGVFRSGGSCIGVYYDDPEVTAPEKQRADVGVTIGPEVTPPPRFQVVELAGGPHAVLRHIGSYATLDQSYRWLYSTWLPDSGRVPADAPPYERYLNDAGQVPESELLTDICIPLLR